MASFCSACGTQVPVEGRFCPGCGKMISVDQPISSAPMDQKGELVAFDQTPRPWSRFFAKILDMSLWGSALSPVAFIVGLWGNDSGSFVLVLAAVTSISYPFAEAFLLYRYNTTPGKLLMGISVHSQASYTNSLLRSLTSTFIGAFAFFPIIGYFPMLFFRDVYMNEGATPWDKTGFATKSWSWYSWIGAVFGSLIVLFSNGYFLLMFSPSPVKIAHIFYLTLPSFAVLYAIAAMVVFFGPLRRKGLSSILLWFFPSLWLVTIAEALVYRGLSESDGIVYEYIWIGIGVALGSVLLARNVRWNAPSAPRRASVE